MKIAILGTSPTWKDAPFGDPEWEIWVCNRAGLDQGPWRRLFEIHKNLDYESPAAKAAYLERLNGVHPPQQVVSIIPIASPAHVLLDREALFAKYGVIWFSSSFGYMLACAIEEKPTDIGLWGIDLEDREEYVVQFSGVRHFIDLAKFIGIAIHVPERCALMRDPKPYPDRFETTMALTLEAKAKQIETIIWKREQAVLYRQLTIAAEHERLRLAATPALLPKGRKVLRALGKEIEDDAFALDRLKASLNRAKGELFATQHYKRLFVWNVLPPDLGAEQDTDVEDSGPI